MKPYEFNGEFYTDLDSLAKAYIENFELGVEDIYDNAKLLIKFVKSMKKSKEYAKEIASILTYTKYKNNALTFIIYSFLDDKKVYINGKEFTLELFIKSLKQYPDKSNILMAFMEDYGISKTFATEDDNQKLAVDAFFIENNFDDPFTIKYLNTYYDYQIIESLNARISTIAVNGEECFRRATKVAFNEDFQLGIAHKLGFRAAIDMHKEVNPIFKAVKLLKEKKETEEDYLKKIITDTFYWWLLDNLDKYEPLKKESKPTFKRLIQLKKEFDKYQKMIEDRKITDISLDYLADISRSIYLNYLNFVTLFRNGKINETEFILNSEIVCLDAEVSALSSIAGQLLIPVPLLGAVVGNAVGTTLYQITKDNFSAKEQKLVEEYIAEINKLDDTLQAQYGKFLEDLADEMELFIDILNYQLRILL